MRSLAVAIGLAAALAAGASSPVGAQIRSFDFTPNAQFFQQAPPLEGVADLGRVYLSCVVLEEKRAVITNNTGAATSDGTQIWLQIVTIPTGERITEVITERGIPAGQSIAPGIINSSACYAWYNRPPVLDPG